MPRRDSDIDAVFVESFMVKTAVLYGEDSSLCGVFSESLIHIVELSCHYCVIDVTMLSIVVTILSHYRVNIELFWSKDAAVFFSLWIEEAASERS